MVEHQLPKLAAWVRFPSPAPNDKKGGMLPFIFVSAHVAQQAERRLGKAEVAGSSPVVGSIWLLTILIVYDRFKKSRKEGLFFFFANFHC